jgi:MFS family permease
VIGGLVNPAITRRLGLLPSLIMAMAAFAVVYAGIGLSPDFAVAAAMMTFEGFFVTMWNIVTVTMRQRIVPPELLGRVNSVYRMLGWGLMPVGALVGGFIAAVAGLRAPYLVAGLITIIALIAALPALVGSASDASHAAEAPRGAPVKS